MKTFATHATIGSTSHLSAAQNVLHRCVETLRSAYLMHRMHSELAQMDARILRDIGVEDDEIARIKAGEAVTPRCWTA